MRPGVAQGFIEFGTVAHKILVYIHDLGAPTGVTALAADLGVTINAVTTTMARLVKRKILFRYKQVSTYETGWRTQWTYWIRPYDTSLSRRTVPNAPGSERQRHYRERRQCTVPRSTTPYASSIEQVAISVVVMATISRTAKAGERATSAPEPTSTGPVATEPLSKTHWPSYRRPKSNGCSL